jgi:hypothetical protein
MKYIVSLAAVAALILLIVFSGCTGTPSAPQPVTTAVPVTTVATPAPTPTANPFPNALALNVPLSLGAGKKTGEMTVSAYKLKPTYTWVDPSWNSPQEQAASSGPLEVQKGYNTAKPHEGNTFLFIYLGVVGTGTEPVYAPSPHQIVVASEGKTYQYSSLASAQTTVNGESGAQYDYQISTGGTGGYVQPGKSNAVKGFLIYEVPATLVPEKTIVLTTPDPATRGEWKLA